MNATEFLAALALSRPKLAARLAKLYAVTRRADDVFRTPTGRLRRITACLILALALPAAGQRPDAPPPCGPRTPYGTVCTWQPSAVYVVPGAAHGATVPPVAYVAVLSEFPPLVQPIVTYGFRLVAISGTDPCTPYTSFELCVMKGACPQERYQYLYAPSCDGWPDNHEGGRR